MLKVKLKLNFVLHNKEPSIPNCCNAGKISFFAGTGTFTVSEKLLVWSRLRDSKFEDRNSNLGSSTSKHRNHRRSKASRKLFIVLRSEFHVRRSEFVFRRPKFEVRHGRPSEKRFNIILPAPRFILLFVTLPCIFSATSVASATSTKEG